MLRRWEFDYSLLEFPLKEKAIDPPSGPRQGGTHPVGDVETAAPGLRHLPATHVHQQFPGVAVADGVGRDNRHVCVLIRQAIGPIWMREERLAGKQEFRL